MHSHARFHHVEEMIVLFYENNYNPFGLESMDFYQLDPEVQALIATYAMAGFEYLCHEAENDMEAACS